MQENIKTKINRYSAQDIELVLVDATTGKTVSCPIPNTSKFEIEKAKSFLISILEQISCKKPQYSHI